MIVSLKFSPHEIQIWNKIKQLHNDPFQLLRKKKKTGIVYSEKSYRLSPNKLLIAKHSEIREANLSCDKLAFY